jgi:flagellar hook-length control protein FliK
MQNFLIVKSATGPPVLPDAEVTSASDARRSVFLKLLRELSLSAAELKGAESEDLSSDLERLLSEIAAGSAAQANESHPAAELIEQLSAHQGEVGTGSLLLLQRLLREENPGSVISDTVQDLSKENGPVSQLIEALQSSVEESGALLQEIGQTAARSSHHPEENSSTDQSHQSAGQESDLQMVDQKTAERPQERNQLAEGTPAEAQPIEKASAENTPTEPSPTKGEGAGSTRQPGGNLSGQAGNSAPIQEVDSIENLTRNQPLEKEPNLRTQEVPRPADSKEDTIPTEVATSPLADSAAEGMQFNEITGPDPIAQISSSVEELLENRQPQVRLQLRPEHLGGIKIELTRSEEGLQVSIQADSQQTAQLLTQHLDELETSLTQNGVQLQNLTVGEEKEEQRLPQQKRGQQDSPHPFPAQQRVSPEKEHSYRQSTLVEYLI